MIRRLSVPAALACCLAASLASAQEPPAAASTGRCTGVLCDLYYSNTPAPVAGQPQAPDPTHLPCHDFICAAFVGRTPDVVPPAAEPVAAPTPAAESVKTGKHKRKPRKRVTTAEAAKPDVAK